jgi:hypothetical protein
MKRILIIVEGHSEKEFVDKVLTPYLLSREVPRVDCFKIKHTKGGLTKYDHLRKDLIHSVQESEVIISTLIDFYALPVDFPKYSEIIELNDKLEVVDKLEHAIVDDISEIFGDVSNKLFPYIQLHEFEAFVFAANHILFDFYDDKEADFAALKKVVADYPNPEDINQGKMTAPSKRLHQFIPGYSKVNHGVAIIQNAGIEVLFQKCPRFKAWVEMLIENAKSN